MSFEIEAVYENGVLKPSKPLPLEEHQRVTIMVQDKPSIAQSTFGIIGWKGDADVVRKVALDPEFSVTESP